MEEDNKLRQERIHKLHEIRDLGINPYPYSFDKKDVSSDIINKFKELAAEEKTDIDVSVAGRVMTMRKMGKAAFVSVQDEDGRIQLYFRENDLGEDAYKLFNLLDNGDIIGVKGTVFKTKTGEVTIYVKEFQLLTKSLLPLPEKYHGLKDTETRYRKRYLDLIMNPEVKKTFVLRSKLIQEIRRYLDGHGFLEVETPILQPIYGGANAKPFVTHHNALNMRLYMKISPELYLKRLLVGGFTKIYDMNKNFRNEGIDTNHNPEFTMLEWYEAYTDYNKQMEVYENMVSSIAKKVLGTTKIEFRGQEIDLSTPWKRISMEDALKEYASIDVTEYDDEQIKDLVTTYNLEFKGDLVRGNIIQVLFEELVEDKLIQPTFVIDHPIEVSPLTKKHRTKKGCVERFEVFISGMEVGNAYSELNDSIDQNERLKKQEELRVIDEEAQPMDEDFVEALEYGMPPTGGVGMGIDRIMMILTNQPSIRDVILFPTMKNKEE